MMFRQLRSRFYVPTLPRPRLVQIYERFPHCATNYRTYFTTRNLQATEKESDFYDLSNKLNISDFESSKLIEEAEPGAHIDYMAENDDHYFGKWDPPSANRDTTENDIKIQVPSPKRVIGKRISIGDILQESMKLETITEMNEDSQEMRSSRDADVSTPAREHAAYNTDIGNVMPDGTAFDDPHHVDDNFSSEENQNHELLAEADELLHTTELEIEDNEINHRTEKWGSTSWLEDSIMGAEAKTVTLRENSSPFPSSFVEDSTRAQRTTSASGNFPWNHDLGDLSTAGRGRHRRS